MGKPPLRYPDPQNILIIKLSALGDFVQALGLLRALRHHHPRAHITLLTTAPYENLARQSGYCDDIIIDARPRLFDCKSWLALRRILRAGQFQRVYDLQNNDRTAIYRRLLAGRRRPDWVGARRRTFLRNKDVTRAQRHAFDRHVETLSLVGLHDITIDDLSWLPPVTAPESLGVKPPFILLVPGSAPSRPEKRWPVSSYAALAAHLQEQGLQPVILGTASESDLAAFITQQVPGVLDLCGRTALADIPALARAASGAIGNDTGPMHMIAPTGCPALILFSRHSDPVRHAPRGARVAILRADELSTLPVAQVVAALPTR